MAWDPLIRKVGLQNGISPAEIDDFVCQIYLEWLEGEYHAKFDPNKGAFTTFFWSFVKTRSMRDRDRGIREDRHLEWRELSDDYDEDEPTVMVEDPDDHYQIAADEAEFESIFLALRETAPPKEVIFHILEGDGLKETYRVERSLETLARFMVLGMTQREIAKIYQRSVGTVASMVQELRSHPVIVQKTLLGAGLD